jgi:hypothetical protein
VQATTPPIYGIWSGVTRTVHAALCGIEFPPAAGDSGGTFVPGQPRDLDQVLPGLSQQGHRTGLKGSVAHPGDPSWRVLSRAYGPPAPNVGAVNVAVLDRWTRKTGED